MKKFLSVVLVMVMLMSTIALTSCTLVDAFIEGFTNGGIPRDLIELPEDEYKKQCKTYKYEDIIRYPDTYNKQLAVFKGEVVQIMRDGDRFQMRVNVTYSGGRYTDTIYVFYTQKSNENFLEGDIVLMYGELRGTQIYESIMGAQIEIPRIYVQYMELLK